MLNHLGCNRIVLKLNINKNKQSNQFNSRNQKTQGQLSVDKGRDAVYKFSLGGLVHCSSDGVVIRQPFFAQVSFKSTQNVVDELFF